VPACLGGGAVLSRAQLLLQACYSIISPVSQRFCKTKLVVSQHPVAGTHSAVSGCACLAAVCCSPPPPAGDGGSMVSTSEYLKMAGVSGGGAQYGKK
jgi:hypothetical protein